MTLGELPAQAARRYPQKDAMVYEDRRLTFADFHLRVNRCANALLAMGLRAGDKVAVLSRNRPEMLEVCFAAARLGIIFVPINFRLKGEEIRFCLNDAQAHAFFVTDKLATEVAPVRHQLHVARILSLDDDYERLLHDAAGTEPELRASANDPFAILYTSGSTGHPKGVLLSHCNYLSGVLNHIIAFAINPSDVCVHYMPLYHAMQLSMAIAQVYLSGKSVIVENFDATHFWRLIRKEGITYSVGTPTMVMQMIDTFENGERQMGTFRTMGVGGQGVPLEMIKRAQRVWGPNVLFQVYGLTEASPLLTYMPKHEMAAAAGARRLGAIGKEMFNCHVRVVDQEDRDVAPGFLGEIIARGPVVMQGYFGRPEETAAALRGGWLRTGDVGTVDENGFIYHVDRSKELIISGGENISPREVEEVLYGHPCVAQCAVIGIPDPKWGETPKAVVVLKPDATEDAQALIQYCRSHLAHYKCPTGIVFVTDMPKDPLGKIQKRLLREQLG